MVNRAEGALLETHTTKNSYPFRRGEPGLKGEKDSPVYVFQGDAAGSHPQNLRVLQAYVTYVGHMFTSSQLKGQGWFPASLVFKPW